MKNLIIATLMASAAVLATVGRGAEYCVDGRVSSTGLSPAAGPAITVTNCIWGAETTFEVDVNATSLVVSGGSTEGPVQIVAEPTNAFALTIRNQFTVTHGLDLRGALPEGSSVTITGCTFNATSGGVPIPKGRDMKPMYMTTEVLLNLNRLRLSAADVLISNNVFEADTTGEYEVDGIRTPYSSGLSTVTIADNTFNASGTNGYFSAVMNYYTRFANSVFTAKRNTIVSSGASCVGFDMNMYSIFDTAESFQAQDGTSKEGRRGRGSRRRAKREASTTASPAGRSFSVAKVDWSEVTDDVARVEYGKSTFEILDNEFGNVETPWEIYEYDGCDWQIEGNTAASSRGSIEPVYEYNGDYYAISVSISKNTFAVSDVDETVKLSVYFWEFPGKSTMQLSQNTFVTGMVSDVAAVFLTGRSVFPNTTVVSISQNTFSSYSGVTGVASDRWIVFYNGSPVYYYDTVETTGRIALCDNTLFGTKLDTDELVNASFGYSVSSVPLVPVSECSSYTLPPKRPANAACGRLPAVGLAASLAALIATVLA